MNMNKKMEVFLTTISAEQHLRLHGWLKQNKVTIKSENIVKEDDHFGTFMVYMTDEKHHELLTTQSDNQIEKRPDLFEDIDVMSSESDRWSIFKSIKHKDKLDPDYMFKKIIKDFMFNFQVNNENDINEFVKQANETSLRLFKQNKDFIDDYVKTTEMSKNDKLKDLELMIEHFVQEERYEDCALLVEIKNKIKKFYETSKTKRQL